MTGAVRARTHADAGQTELDAAARAATYAETLEGKVLELVKAAGPEGLTALEARQALGFGVERHYSVAPRLSDLKHQGKVELAPIRRGRHAAYVAVTE